MTAAIDERKCAQEACVADGMGATDTPLHPTGRSPGAARVREQIRSVAPFNSTVLILGDSGTGKERIALQIHELSPRRDHAFVPINCGAIPADLLESELFGHEKGAFTGALSARVGRFELADGGTLFLDEIGDMSPSMQVKLLRVLQEKRFERVGSCLTRECNVRVIAATNKRLDDEVRQGNFRLDLFFRLNVFPIEVPPLRERIVDLPQLIGECNSQLLERKHRPVRIPPQTCAQLMRYAWPGNIRELENLLELLSIAHPGELIGPERLPARFQQPAAVAPAPAEETAPGIPEAGMCLRTTLDGIEQRFIHEAMTRAGGVVAKAAQLLGLRRTTLTEKLRRQPPAASQTPLRIEA
jgi:sigma-54 specific flagellar transcriptional regulator A